MILLPGGGGFGFRFGDGRGGGFGFGGYPYALLMRSARSGATRSKRRSRDARRRLGIRRAARLPSINSQKKRKDNIR